jgi:hypothetical protein
MKKTRKRIFRSALILALLLALIGLTVSTYAYWDSLEKTTNETINLGQGQEVVISVVPAPGTHLIPAGAKLDTNDTYAIDLEYDVDLQKPEASDLTLTVTASNVKIGGDDTNAGLVNIAFAYNPLTKEINSTKSVHVKVTVTLTEPATVEIYEAIKNKPVTFDLTFTAA